MPCATYWVAASAYGPPSEHEVALGVGQGPGGLGGVVVGEDGHGHRLGAFQNARAIVNGGRIIVVASLVESAARATAVVASTDAASVNVSAAPIVHNGGGVEVAGLCICASLFVTNVGFPQPAAIGAGIQGVLGFLNLKVKHFHIGEPDVEVRPRNSVPFVDPDVGAGVDLVGGAIVVGQAVHRYVG